MLGDIILSEPKAMIGFAGPRVIEQTIGKQLPEGFQRAEFQLEHDFVVLDIFSDTEGNCHTQFVIKETALDVSARSEGKFWIQGHNISIFDSKLPDILLAQDSFVQNTLQSLPASLPFVAHV